MAIGAGHVAADARGQGQDADAVSRSSVVSADHVSEGLKRPELQIPPVPFQQPTFRSGVTEKLETPLDVIRRELREEAHHHPYRGGLYSWDAWPGGRPPQGVDVIPALMSLVTHIKTIRREHAEAEARQMVQEELSEFCAQHDCTQAAELPIEEGVIAPR